MSPRLKKTISNLESNGWKIDIPAVPNQVPEILRQRYGWLPADVEEFVATVGSARKEDDKSWFVTSSELEDQGDSAFCWNQWEIDSLSVAGDDAAWRQEITSFWDSHFPLVLSVRNDYRYLAINSDDCTIVGGVEPEFEETDKLAGSFAELIENIGTSQIAPYV